VWLYVRSRDQEMLDHVPIPVELSLPAGQADNYEIEIPSSSQVPVSFAGPPSRIRELRSRLQRGEVRVEITLTVPEDRLQESPIPDTVRAEAGDLPPPAGVTPIVVQGRNQIAVILHRLVERRLPVRPEQAPEERPAQVSVEPATV